MTTLSFARVCAFASVGIVVVSGGEALAARPASVGGNWTVVGNQTVSTLNITQFVTGAACKPIAGTAFGNSIQGVYCPTTGRIVFARRNSSGVPFQIYEGTVSQDGAVDRIGGTFIIWNSAGGAVATDGPDYNFSASK
jgi:hypothetical protein